MLLYYNVGLAFERGKRLAGRAERFLHGLGCHCRGERDKWRRKVLRKHIREIWSPAAGTQQRAAPRWGQGRERDDGNGLAQ